MNKRRKIFQRAAALLCCMVLLPSLFVFSVSADSDDGFFDVLQFGTANGSGYQVVTGTLPLNVVYQTSPEPFFYIDALVVSPTLLPMYYNGTMLNRQIIGNVHGAYRCRYWGNLVGNPSGYLDLTFNIPGQEGTEVSVIFEQLRLSSSTRQMQYQPTVGTLMANPTQYTPVEAMPDANTSAHLTFKYNDSNQCEPFYSNVTLTDWKGYDYLDVYLQLNCASISSIDVTLSELSIPFEISYLSSDFYPDQSWAPNEQYPTSQFFNISIRLDLTSLHRDVSADPVISIHGLYAEYWPGQGIYLNSVIGIMIGSVPSELSTFWQRLQGLLVALFGSDPAAGEANQTQNEYHNDSQELVMQAVDNWDGNIDYAEAGFNDSIQFVSPSLAWLSMLGSKIYNNLGVFRSLYLAVGLMSVIMLLLSKSGVAAKLSHSIGRGGKKNA